MGVRLWDCYLSRYIRTFMWLAKTRCKKITNYFITNMNMGLTVTLIYLKMTETIETTRQRPFNPSNLEKLTIKQSQINTWVINIRCQRMETLPCHQVVTNLTESLFSKMEMINPWMGQKWFSWKNGYLNWDKIVVLSKPIEKKQY